MRKKEEKKEIAIELYKAMQRLGCESFKSELFFEDNEGSWLLTVQDHSEMDSTFTCSTAEDKHLTWIAKAEAEKQEQELDHVPPCTGLNLKGDEANLVTRSMLGHLDKLVNEIPDTYKVLDLLRDVLFSLSLYRKTAVRLKTEPVPKSYLRIEEHSFCLDRATAAAHLQNEARADLTKKINEITLELAHHKMRVLDLLDESTDAPPF